MRELDRILEAFLVDGYPELDSEQKQAFARILEYPDPDLHAYLLGHAEPSDSELAMLFRRIHAAVSA